MKKYSKKCLYSSCPNSETCCQLESGQYGCCPLRKSIIVFIYLFFNLFDILAKAICCSKEIKNLKMKIKGNET